MSVNKMAVISAQNHLTHIKSKSLSKQKEPPLHHFGNYGRAAASSGLWLCALIPLACCPGFYELHSQCKPSPIISSIYAIQVGISSLYILYDFYCLQGTTKDTHESKLQRSRLMCVMTNPYMPVAISCLLLFMLRDFDMFETPVVVLCSFVCCLLQRRLAVWLFNHFNDSFTIGEGLLIIQAASLSVSLAVKGILTRSQTTSENKKILSFVQVAIVVSSLLGYVLWKFRGKLNAVSFMLVVIAMAVVGIGGSTLILGEWSPSWLLQVFFSPTRVALVGWWMNISVIIVVTSVISQRFTHLPQTVLRKTFHFLMTLIMVPGIILDPSLTYFASTAAIIAFVLMEVLRVTKIEPFSQLLNTAFCTFLDEKDSGSLVLSHLYLLGGLALPLWLYPCDFLHVERPPIYLSSISDPVAFKVQFCVLPLLAGVLSVGIGDTAASIGGTYFGKHKFPGTKKTIEGSLCSLVCQLIFVWGVLRISYVNLWWNSWPRLLLSIVLNVVVEAFTDQVDNLVLPLLLYTPLMDP